jgi:aspartyl-tRNA synthetase
MVCMFVTDTDSLREVVVFWNSGGGLDPFTGAPVVLIRKQQIKAGVDTRPPAMG